MKPLLISLIFLCASVCLCAQTQEIGNVGQLKPGDLKAIVKGETVQGYYIFYQVSAKPGGKENLYLLNVYDEKLNETVSRGFKFPVKVRLVKVDHNGSSFCFQLFTSTSRQYEFVIYDDKLTETGRIVRKLPKDVSAAVALQVSYYDMMPLAGLGFGVYGPDARTRKWTLVAYNSIGEEAWRQGAANPEKMRFETVHVLGGNSRNVALFESFRKSAKTFSARRQLRVLDPLSGAELVKAEIKTEKAVAFHSVFEAGTDYLLAGTYAEKPGLPKHGEALVHVSGEGGIIGENYMSLAEAAIKLREGQLSRLTFTNKSVDFRQVASIDGSLFVFADLYEKKSQQSANTATDPVNMVIFELNSKLGLRDFYLLESTGSVATRNRFLFTRPGRNENSLPFLFARQLGDNETDYIIGSGTYNRGRIEPGNVRMFSKTSRNAVLPGDDGKVLIFEFLEKEKKANLRLERL